MSLIHLYRHWPIMLATLFLGAIAGLVAAKLQPQRYVATMTISSVGPEDSSLTLGSSVPGGAGVLQALRGIAGSAAGAGGNGDFNYFIDLLRSDRTALRLLGDPVALRQLFPKEWDARTLSWHRPDGLLSSIKANYDDYFYGLGYVPPDVPRIKQQLGEVFGAQFDIETGSYLLSVKNQECAVARSILGTVFITTDRVLKSEKRLRFEENIASLRNQLVQLENVQMRSQIADAILAQYLRRIAAESRLPLAARILDGPGCPSRPTLPLPITYASVGAMLAFVLTLGWLTTRVWWRSGRMSDSTATELV